MSRTLPVLATVGVVLASLGTFLLSGPAVLAVICVLAILTAVLLVLERSLLPVVLGAILAVGGIIGFLAIEPVNSERLDLSALNDNLGPAFVVGLGLWVAGAALALLWNEVEPGWLAIAGAVVMFVAYIAIWLVDADLLGTLSDPAATVPTALFVLLAAAPSIRLLWTTAPPRAPPVGPPA